MWASANQVRLNLSLEISDGGSQRFNRWIQHERSPYCRLEERDKEWDKEFSKQTRALRFLGAVSGSWLTVSKKNRNVNHTTAEFCQNLNEFGRESQASNKITVHILISALVRLWAEDPGLHSIFRFLIWSNWDNTFMLLEANKFVLVCGNGKLIQIVLSFIFVSTQVLFQEQWL